MNSKTMRNAKTTLRMPRVHKGLGMIEIALGIGLTALVSIGIVQITNDQNAASRAASAASMMAQVQSASQDYIKANYQQLVALAPVGGNPVAIRAGRPSVTSAIPGGPAPNMSSIQGGGFLPPTFVDRDNYRFRHVLLVRQPVAGTLDGLVVQASDSELGLGADTGTPIRDTDLGRMVSRMGNNGGARFKTNPIAANASVVQGNGGSWASNIGDWTASGFTPQTGRAAATVGFGNASMLSDYLNRYDIGLPEANTMRASLNMGGNDIAGAKNINATGAITAGGTAASNISNFPGLSMYMANGGIACAGGAVGCKFWIDDNAGFASSGDGWVHYQSSAAGTGLSLDGVGNNLYVGGAATIAGDANVGGNLGANGTIYGNAGIFSGGDMNAAQNINAGQNIGAGGNINANGNLSANQDVGAGRDLYAGRNLGVAQDAYIGRNLTSAGDGWIQGYLTVSKDINVRGNSTVAGNSTVNGNASVGQNLKVGGEVQLASTGNLYAGCGTTGAITSSADGSGKLLACVGGRWNNAASLNTALYNIPAGIGVSPNGSATGYTPPTSYTQDIGRHAACILGRGQGYTSITQDFGDGTYEWQLRALDNSTSTSSTEYNPGSPGGGGDNVGQFGTLTNVLYTYGTTNAGDIECIN